MAIRSADKRAQAFDAQNHGLIARQAGEQDFQTRAAVFRTDVAGIHPPAPSSGQRVTLQSFRKCHDRRGLAHARRPGQQYMPSLRPEENPGHLVAQTISAVNRRPETVAEYQLVVHEVCRQIGNGEQPAELPQPLRFRIAIQIRRQAL